MGLDIQHIKFTFSPDEPDCFYLVDDWDEECSVPLEHYAHWLVDIPYSDTEKYTAIVKDASEMERLRLMMQFHLEMKYDHVFVGEGAELEDAIERYCQREQLDSGDSYRGKDLKGTFRFSTLSFCAEKPRKGLYYREVGNQRRNMNQYFYDHYRKNMFWGNRADFEEAYRCIECEDEPIYEDELRRIFQRDFLDNFQFGTSILCVG